MRPSDPRLRVHLRPARASVAGVLAAGVVGAVLVLAQAWAVTDLVVAVVRGGPLGPAAGLVVGLLLARAVVQWLGDRCATAAAVRVGAHLRDGLARASVGNGAGTSSGALTALLTRGVAAAEPYLTRYLPALVLAGVLPPLVVLAIASQDLLSAGIVLSTLPLVPVFGALVGLATRDRAREQWRAMESLSGHFLDVMRGLPTLVAYRRARAQSEVVARVTDRYRRATAGTLRLAFASSAVLELVATLSVALVAVTVGVRLADGGLDLHTALVVLLLAPEAYWPLRRVGAEFHAAAEGVATFEKASELLDVETPVTAIRSTSRTSTTSAGAVPVSARGASDALVVRDLEVVHTSRSAPALSGLSATFPAQGVTLVTGPSGSGKTTLLRVLAGLVRPTSGTVRVGDAAAAGHAWQAQVGWLPQRPHLCAGSVAANLRLARPDASDDALWAALRDVALEERVRASPDGLDADVGEDGRHLSAGERARLALARLILADRPWNLVDEPTAHLDPVTRRVIADVLVELGRRRAVILVAHDPGVEHVANHRVHLEAPAHTSSARPGPRAEQQNPLARRVAADPVEPPSPGGFVLSTLLGSLSSASGVALTATAGWLIVQASARPAVLTLLLAVVAVRTFGLARPVLRYAERLRSHDAALRLLAARRVQVYDAVVPLVPGALPHRRGDVLASMVDDVDAVVDHELRVRMPVRSFTLVTAMTSLVAAWILPLAGVVVLALGGAAGLAYVVARAGAAPAERVAVEARARLSGALVELLAMRDELVMWQQTDRAALTTGDVGRGLGVALTRAGNKTASARALLVASTGAAMAVVALLAGTVVKQGSLGGPTAALLVLLPLALLDPALPLADAGALSARTRAAQTRLEHLAQTRPAVVDGSGAAPPLSDRIELDRVEAGWAGSPALRDLSLVIEPGARVGVVGPSGSGKSTLAALLLRFLDPRRGVACLGGTDMRNCPLDQVRSIVGLVDDDPHLFATTVVENVRLARPDATDGEVQTALRQARLEGWVDGLPEGLHTWIGDGHAEVSGGERARLGIARSLLAHHPVLVLDEPAAHLDHATAGEIASEVLSGARSRSVVWISHADVGLDLVDEVVRLSPVAAHRPARTYT